MTEGTPPNEQPIQVDTSVTATAIIVAFRQFTLILAGAATLIGFLKGRDLAGLIAWVRGDSFALLVTTAAALATFIYGQYRAWKDRRAAVTLTKAVPDTVAVLAPSWLTRLLMAVRAISTGKENGNGK